MEISINDFKLERVYVIKFLGVLIDNDLKWKAQVSAVHKKICRNLAIMTKTRSKFSSEALLKLYHVLIQPHLFYFSEIWGYWSKSVLSPVTKIQKSAVRTICGLPYYSSTSLVFKELKILNFVDFVATQQICQALQIAC